MKNINWISSEPQSVQRRRLLFAKLLTGLVIIIMLLSKGKAYPLLDIVGFLLMVTAGVGRIWSAVYISGFKSGKVVKDGPYSIMRNPLYFFSFLGFIGAGLTFSSFILAFLLLIIFLLTHLPTILSEERKLENLFGEEYQNYKKEVPRFFPKPSLFYNPEETICYPRKFTKTLVEATYLIFGYALIKIIVWFHTIEVLPTLWVLV